MKRFTGHREPWGEFLDVKVNAPLLLSKQLARFRGDQIFFSSVTDPYQPAEKTYEITRSCLGILAGSSISVSILTKSPLVLRDLDLLKKLGHVEVGFTITTDDDHIRRAFEPHAPQVKERIEALRKLHDSGIPTYAFVGPVLPMNPDRLTEMIGPYVGHVLIDRMNYLPKTLRIYRQQGLTEWLNRDFSYGIIERLQKGFSGKGVCC
jgi:DNA repair photolyase